MTDYKKRIEDLLGLERNLNGQLIPSNLEDFQSDWTFTVDELLALLHQVEAEAYQTALLGICPSCKQSVKDWKPASGAFAPEWYATMRENNINPSTGHKTSCKLAHREES